jgi:hypothetical protein
VPEREIEKIRIKETNGIKKEFISIIYNKNNNSPKYFELQKSKILLFVVGLPTLTLIALVFGIIGLIHTSPFHLLENYQQNSMAREAIAKTKILLQKLKTNEEEKAILSSKLAETKDQLKMTLGKSEAPSPIASVLTSDITSINIDKHPVVTAPSSSGTANSIGLSALSLFRPIIGQRDRSKQGTLTLSAFNIIENRDTINLQFNIIPAIVDEDKLAGFIIVLMKNELTIQIYPQDALKTADAQINYIHGEPFSIQRFRTVDANFLKPRKSGNYNFSVYIFAKNGDLLHYQSLILPVKF